MPASVPRFRSLVAAQLVLPRTPPPAAQPARHVHRRFDRGKGADEQKAAASRSKPFREVFAGLFKSPTTLDHILGMALAVRAPAVVERMPTVDPLDAVTHRSVAGRDSRRDDQAAITEPDDGHLEALVEPLAGTQPLMASGAAWAMLGECALRQALQAFALPARPTLTESFPQPWTRLRLHARVSFRSTRLSAVIPASPVPSPRSSRTRRAGWRAGRSSTTSASMPIAARARATETR